MKFTKPLILLLGVCALSMNAQAREPLLQKGKTSVYQRILTTPSCVLYKDRGLRHEAGRPAAFTQYYVYQDSPLFVEVGSDAVGDRMAGFLRKDCTIEWRQQVALMFTNHADRNRALIYESEQDLDEVINDKDPSWKYKQAASFIDRGRSAPGVISIEPENYVDYKEKFYLLPVLNSVESMFSDGTYTYKHQIASLTSEESKSHVSKVTGQSQGSDAADITGFRSALVFVIDSSISMQPYIDAVREVLRSVYGNLESKDLSDRVHFGIVAFRGDSRKVRGLEYTTKVFLKPGEAENVNEFNMAVKDLAQAKVSSLQISEDAYGGINSALNEIDWSGYGGRYVVLITDAGAIDSSDPQSSTGFDADAIRHEAEKVGAALYTVHLKTPLGVRSGNFKAAKAQYEKASFNKILNKPLYYQVNTDSTAALKSATDILAGSVTEQVYNASLGKLAAGSVLSRETESAVQVSVEGDTAKIGYAMQLAFLGRIQGTKVPDFMTGWISDRDVIDHNKVTVVPVVMVNMLQLNDLFILVKGVLEAGVAGQLSSDSMFEKLKALAAQMNRDPDMLARTDSLEDMGITSELLDGLPYKSRISSLSADDWYALGSQEQENILRSLEASLNYIEHCISDKSRWVLLNENADLTESVYPIPLDALP